MAPNLDSLLALLLPSARQSIGSHPPGTSFQQIINPPTLLDQLETQAQPDLQKRKKKKKPGKKKEKLTSIQRKPVNPRHFLHP